MLKKQLTIFSLLVFSHLCLASNLEQRVEDLELEVAKMNALSSEGGVLKSFTSPVLKIGGLFQSAITALNGPDTESQVAADSNIMGLNFAADINDRFSFVTQALFLIGNFKTPTHFASRKFQKIGLSSLITFMAHGYGQYYFSDALKVRLGLGWVPFGRTYEQTELIVFRRAGRSQLGGSPVSASLWQGVSLDGLLFQTGEYQWNYNAYTFTSPEEPTDLGFGTRIYAKKRNSSVIFGISQQQGKNLDGTYNSFGIDLEVKNSKLGFITEYGIQFSGDPNKRDAFSAYFEPYLAFNRKHLVFLYTDYLDNPANLTVALASDPIRIWKNGIGYNWTPFSELKIRAEFSKYDYRDASQIDSDGKIRDYYETLLTTSLVF